MGESSEETALTFKMAVHNQYAHRSNPSEVRNDRLAQYNYPVRLV